MYLWEGRKKWNFISQKWITSLVEPSTGKALDISPQDVEVLAVTAETGDFVYFPPGWLHRVWTYEKSMGLGGYMMPKGSEQEAEQALAQLAALNQDAVW